MVHRVLGIPVASWCYRCKPNGIDTGRQHREIVLQVLTSVKGEESMAPGQLEDQLDCSGIWPAPLKIAHDQRGMRQRTSQVVKIAVGLVVEQHDQLRGSELPKLG